jgi:hypothetical protein
MTMFHSVLEKETGSRGFSEGSLCLLPEVPGEEVSSWSYPRAEQGIRREPVDGTRFGSVEDDRTCRAQMRFRTKEARMDELSRLGQQALKVQPFSAGGGTARLFL